jgi:hypothetical protein
MPTLGEALGALEDELFVGRGRELAGFDEWLSAAPPAPAILDVSGRGGIGKTALLRAFARRARRRRKVVAFADSRDFPHTPAGLLRALTPVGTTDPLAHLNAARPLILLDTCEELGDLRRYVQEEFLPCLDSEVKLVLAGRYPLAEAWGADSPWRRLVQAVPLDGLNAAESAEYLRRRGLEETALRERVARAAGGNPLALTLAADLVVEVGARELAAAPEWHLVVRTLVEQLLRDVRDPTLRELLQACAVVRQFDEATLTAVTGRVEIGAAFGQLCRLAVARPAEHGLMLHDDVRRALAEDLRWRRPAQYDALRLRALAYYRERVRTAAPVERGWLVAERLFLCEDAFLQAVLFTADDLGQVWVEPGRPEDHSDIVRIWRFALQHVAGPELEHRFDEYSLEATCAHTAMILRYPGTRLRVARDRDGLAIGFCTVLPVCQDSLGLVVDHPILAPLVRAYWRPDQLAMLPATPESTNVYYLLQYAYTDVERDAVRAALLCDWFAMFALGGIFLANAPVPPDHLAGRSHYWVPLKTMLETCGFECIASGPRVWTPHYPVNGYVLDLTRIGVDAWLEAIVAGRRPPRALRHEALEHELLAALTHWHDDARLAQSPLREHAPLVALTNAAPGPEELRQAIGAALARARARATPEQELAYRALELAYLEKATSHERAAERLAVSPRTFYRLLKRGVQGLTAALAAD